MSHIFDRFLYADLRIRENKHFLPFFIGNLKFADFTTHRRVSEQHRADDEKWNFDFYHYSSDSSSRSSQHRKNIHHDQSFSVGEGKKKMLKTCLISIPTIFPQINFFDMEQKLNLKFDDRESKSLTNKNLNLCCVDICMRKKTESDAIW